MIFDMLVSMKIIACDICSKEFKVSGVSAAEITRQARANGWLVGDAKHYCPKHRPKPQDLRWHRSSDGNLYAPTYAGEYRIVKHEPFGYVVITPLNDNAKPPALNQRMAKDAAQAHFNQHYCNP